MIFALLAASRRRTVTRLGRTVLIQGADAFREALTRVPLDRTAQGTTGGIASAVIGDGVLFDQHGSVHRAVRKSLAADLGAAGVEELRLVWRAVLARRLAALGTGGDVNMVRVSAELAGATVARCSGWTLPRSRWPSGRRGGRRGGTRAPAGDTQAGGGPRAGRGGRR